MFFFVPVKEQRDWLMHPGNESVAPDVADSGSIAHERNHSCLNQFMTVRSFVLAFYSVFIAS